MSTQDSTSPDEAILVAGGGICGLATALALARAGRPVQLYEQAPAFGEVGAGLQLGPNATRVLLDWGLEPELRRLAAFPEQLVARDAMTGAVLGTLPLAGHMERRYGAPYATLHRADLHSLLADAVRDSGGVGLHLGTEVRSFHDLGHAVTLQAGALGEVQGSVLVGADGLHSTVRRQLLQDGLPRPVGDVAYRSMLDLAALPAAHRSNQVTVWMGSDLHAVQYPVRGGRAMNFVILARQSHYLPPPEGWDHAADSTEVDEAMATTCAPLRELVAAVPAASVNAYPWRKWVLAAREPVGAATQMARGRVALLGDAAHPMRPYLAQGAGMAIEDAATLVQELGRGNDAAGALRRYATARWQRCARVQSRSERNGRIFHAQGLLRLGRDMAIRTLGEQLLDQPWLYGATV